MNDVTPKTTTGLASESGHWYSVSGDPAYEILGANGKMRPVNLRDARKLGLVPGFSAIAQLEAKPGLTQWLINQAYLAAMTLPRIEGEQLEAFITRAKADAGAQAERARNRGTELHAAIQRYYEGQPVSEEHKPYVMPVVSWILCRFPKVQKWHAEQSFAHPSGYGCKLDLWSEEAVIDFKCKDFKAMPDKSFAYPEHAMQLWAQAEALKKPWLKKINLFISSTVPGLIYPHEWDDDTNHMEPFKCLLRLWQLRRNYFCGFAK
jgi:hypothetical protein